jgi:hypothetical protein
MEMQINNLNTDPANTLELHDLNTDVDLFSDELEDRFNAGIVSTASTVSTAISTVSTICSAY